MNGYCIDQLINDQAGLFRPGWIVMPQCTDWVSELQVGEVREQATILLARRAPTIKRWSLDARSEGRFACSLWGREKRERLHLRIDQATL
jgi:hypothetical protein